MELSYQKRKNLLRIAIIVAIVLVLSAIILFVLIPKKTTKPETVVAPKAKPAVSKKPVEWDRDSMMNAYRKEQERFAKVLKEASDEELFVVLNYAIANHYVPNRDVDPFFNMHVMVGSWQRSLMVYDNLSKRKDLLKKIYPNLKVLDEYVNWGRHGEPYPDDKIAQTILNNVQEESRKMNNGLVSKYFGTPLLDRYE